MNSDDGRLIDTDTGGILRVAWPRAESWWPRPESNQRHTDFQSAALPTELLGRAGASGNRSARKRSADYKGKVLTPPRSRGTPALSAPRNGRLVGKKRARLEGGLSVSFESPGATP